MALKDKTKWNKKYKENPSLLKERKASTKLEKYIKKAQGNKALEIACGSGRNSIFLAENNFEVDAFDISDLAIKSLKEKNLLNINAQIIDLEGFIPKENNYDLIIKTNYLDREIIPNLMKSLKKEGILIIETYMDHKNNTKPIGNSNFLLKKDELKEFFNGNFEILDYDEFDNEENEMYKMKKQAIVVKKK